MRRKHAMESKYEVIIKWSEEDQCFYAVVPELPGCMTNGATYDQAARNAKEAMASWLKVARERGQEIPEPISSRAVSGNFQVRLPKALHRDLVEEAQAQGASLNQYILMLLSSRRLLAA